MDTTPPDPCPEGPGRADVDLRGVLIRVPEVEPLQGR